MENNTILDNYKEILDNCIFTYIDLGSRGGLSQEWKKVGDIVNVVLFEPEVKEAEKLRELAPRNAVVIPKAVWSYKGKVKFHGTRNPSYSSVLNPDEKVLDGTYYYCRNFYEVDEVSEIDVDILEEALKDHNINQIDFLKIDIQGAENYIFNSISNWKSIIGVHTEAYADKLYEDGGDISTTLRQLYENNFQLYDIKTIAEAPIVEIDGIDVFSKELLNARPKSGYRSRSMVYDLLLFNDKHDSLTRYDKSFARKMIFVFCVYEYFDHALYIAIKSFNNNVFEKSEKDAIVRSVINLHKISLSKYQLLKEQFKSPSFELKKR